MPEDAAALSIEIEQVVRDTPGGEVRYHLRLEDGGALVQAGPATSPDLRLITDYDVAVRIQRGELNAQQALAAGLLKVQGQFARLVRANDALRSLEDVFAGVRAATTYEERRRSR